jgi:hypothetical protein
VNKVIWLSIKNTLPTIAVRVILKIAPKTQITKDKSITQGQFFKINFIVVFGVDTLQRYKGLFLFQTIC